MGRQGSAPRPDGAACGQVTRWLGSSGCLPLQIVDQPEDWVIATGLVLELDNRGLRLATEAAQNMLYGRGRRPYGDCRVDLHLTGPDESPPARRADPIAEAAGLALFSAPAENVAWGEGWLPAGGLGALGESDDDDILYPD